MVISDYIYKGDILDMLSFVSLIHSIINQVQLMMTYSVNSNEKQDK